jgi:hypothetical protein
MNWRAIAMAVVAIFVLAAVVYFLVRRGQQLQVLKLSPLSGLKYSDVVVGDGPAPQLRSDDQR